MSLDIEDRRIKQKNGTCGRIRCAVRTPEFFIFKH
jgi:hypothetical protein